MDLGFARAGFDVRWLCETDPFCRVILAQQWPTVPCYHDVQHLGREVQPEAVDVLVGGFP